VVTADRDVDEVRNQLKAWCTRRLNELEKARCNVGRDYGSVSSPTRREGDSRIREKWWAERGSGRYIGDEDSLEAAILYVMEGQ
jgi:hypothetical protein